MKWVAIAGSWRYSNAEIEKKVRQAVNEIISSGYGVVTGGALGVDYIATNEVKKLNPKLDKLKIYLPSALAKFCEHYYKRAGEGVITSKQANLISKQLKTIKNTNPRAVIETKGVKTINKTAYYNRIKKIINKADKLIAFHVNNTAGTQYTIDLAEKKGIPVKIFNFTI